jgi:hypothetical protein
MQRLQNVAIWCTSCVKSQSNSLRFLVMGRLAQHVLRKSPGGNSKTKAHLLCGVEGAGHDAASCQQHMTARNTSQ